jgi:hypothetical protein
VDTGGKCAQGKQPSFGGRFGVFKSEWKTEGYKASCGLATLRLAPNTRITETYTCPRFHPEIEVICQSEKIAQTVETVDVCARRNSNT